MELNYASYLKLDRLLELQEVRSDPEQHDELLFIVIHQVYELWFKLLLHELDRIVDDLKADQLFEAIAGFKRMRMVLKTLVSQIDVLETMTPLSFAAFRERLETASGFQSVQFRELEFALGYKRPEVLRYLDPSWHGYERARRRLEEPSLLDAFDEFLIGRGARLPRGPQAAGEAEGRQRQDELFRLYRDRPEMALLFELMTDVDEGIQEWRYRHVKAVERTIGNKRGTGGSPGVDFLKRTLFRPIFPELWEIRHRM